jgi:dTDP-4-dehydrorhamnose 3,5-epimerase-like enzyme
VDLRAGDGFGRVETFELTPAIALLLPVGCGNAFQTFADHTVYTYLVTAHWTPDVRYLSVDPFDPELGIPWPVPRARATVSDKDAANPPLRDVPGLPPA